MRRGKTDRQTDRLRDGHTDETRVEIKLTGEPLPFLGRKCLPDYQRCDPARHSVAFGGTVNLSTSSLGFVLAVPRCGGKRRPLQPDAATYRWGTTSSSSSSSSSGTGELTFGPGGSSLNSPVGCSAGPRVRGGGNVPPVGHRHSLQSVGGRGTSGSSEFTNELGQGRLTPASLCVLL